MNPDDHYPLPAGDVPARRQIPRVVASVDVPISINGLKRHLRQVKERHGSQVQVVPHENRIDFVKHEKGKVPK